MINTQVFTLPLRVTQLIFAIISLGLTAYVVHLWAPLNYYPWDRPSQPSFLLFCAIWTLLALTYLILTPLRFPRFAHKYAILAVDAVTMIFWFAGFVAFAVVLGDWCWAGTGSCGVSRAATVFGAFEWLLFAVSTVLDAVYCFSHRGSASKQDPNAPVHASV